MPIIFCKIIEIIAKQSQHYFSLLYYYSVIILHYSTIVFPIIFFYYFPIILFLTFILQLFLLLFHIIAGTKYYLLIIFIVLRCRCQSCESLPAKILDLCTEIWLTIVLRDRLWHSVHKKGLQDEHKGAGAAV